MVARGTTWVVSLVVLSIVLTGSAVAGKRPGPTNLRITASSDTSVSLAWDAARTSKNNWWYCVQRDGQGCIRVDPPQTTVTLTRLWPGTTLNYSVVAVDSSGRSASSNTVTFSTPPDTTPPTSPTLSVTGTWPTRIALSWTQSTDNATQVYYTLLADGSPFPAGELGFQSATILDLAPSTTHAYQVVVRDFFGNTAESNTVTVTTPATTDTTPPSAPANLRLSPESASPEVWLDWDPSTDDTDPQSLILYDVYVNGEFAEHGVIGGTDTIVYCRGEGENTITVRAVDTSGNASGFSNAVTFCP